MKNYKSGELICSRHGFTVWRLLKRIGKDDSWEVEFVFKNGDFCDNHEVMILDVEYTDLLKELHIQEAEANLSYLRMILIDKSE